MGLKVQMLDGSRLTFNKALTRNISKIFWPILLIDFIIGIATPGTDPRQRYFDRIAGNNSGFCKASVRASSTAASASSSALTQCRKIQRLLVPMRRGESEFLPRNFPSSFSFSFDSYSSKLAATQNSNPPITSSKKVDHFHNRAIRKDLWKGFLV
jgi:hypothetical protein